MKLALECQPRAAGSKPNALRRSGLIPATLYGHNGAESIALTVNAKTAELLVRDASVNNTMIDVNVPALPWAGKALLKEVQTHPWKRHIYHLSLFSVGTHASLDVDVPVRLVGEAPGVKMGGGNLDAILTELRVRCAPSLIPDAIEVDISQMQLGDSIHVHELKLPEGVESLGEADRVVVQIHGGGGDAAGEAEG